MQGRAYRFRPDELPAFSRYQIECYAPRITACVLGETFMGDAQTPLPTAAKIELWTDCETSGQFRYPHVAVAFNSEGGVTGIAAAETMPEVHGSCYLGLFVDGGHSNLGDTDDWRDPQVFFAAAIRHLGEALGDRR